MIPTNGPTVESIRDYMAAGAAAVGVGREVYPDGFTMESIEIAARRVRMAMDEFRRNSEELSDPR